MVMEGRGSLPFTEGYLSSNAMERDCPFSLLPPNDLFSIDYLQFSSTEPLRMRGAQWRSPERCFCARQRFCCLSHPGRCPHDSLSSEAPELSGLSSHAASASGQAELGSRPSSTIISCVTWSK